MPRSFGPIPSRRRALVRSWPAVWLIAVCVLLVRLYLASLWFRFGVAKLEAGWLTENPVRGLLTVVAAGQTPMPIPALSVVAEWLLAVHADLALSVVLPLTEIALAAAFLTGLYVRHAAATGIVVNTSLILGGLASVAFDGKVIVLQVVALLANSRAGVLGVPGVARLFRRARPDDKSRAEVATSPEPNRRAA